MTREALPGTHLCGAHQGNTSHYHPDNCDMCKLIAARDALRLAVESYGLVPAIVPKASAAKAAQLTPSEQMVMAAMTDQLARMGGVADMTRFLNYWLGQMQDANRPRQQAAPPVPFSNPVDR
jgi:hypothetical protein